MPQRRRARGKLRHEAACLLQLPRQRLMTPRINRIDACGHHCNAFAAGFKRMGRGIWRGELAVAGVATTATYGVLAGLPSFFDILADSFPDLFVG